MTDTNVMLTSAGRRSYLVRYFREALGGHGQVVAANMFGDTAAMQVADIAVEVPASWEPAYIPTLIDICIKHRIKLLLPLHDLDISYLAPHRQEFLDIGVTPVVSKPEFIDVCFDKLKTPEFLKTCGLPVLPTCLYLDRALAAIGEGEFSYPVIVKPRMGFGSIGMHIAHDKGELESCHRLLRKQIVRTQIASVPEFNLQSGILIQQFVRGEEYGIEVINCLKGDFASVIIEKKLAMRSGETDSAIIVDNPLLIELAERIGIRSRHLGLLDMDVIVSDDKPYVIEMNPRFGGHYPFAHIAGADVPAALIAWSKGLSHDPEWLKADVGVCGYKELVPMRMTRR